MPCKKEKKGMLDQIGIRSYDPGAIGWYNEYRKFWERIRKEAKR